MNYGRNAFMLSKKDYNKIVGFYRMFSIENPNTKFVHKILYSLTKKLEYALEDWETGKLFIKIKQILILILY